MQVHGWSDLMLNIPTGFATPSKLYISDPRRFLETRFQSNQMRENTKISNVIKTTSTPRCWRRCLPIHPEFPLIILTYLLKYSRPHVHAARGKRISHILAPYTRSLVDCHRTHSPFNFLSKVKNTSTVNSTKVGVSDQTLISKLNSTSFTPHSHKIHPPNPKSLPHHTLT